MFFHIHQIFEPYTHTQDTSVPSGHGQNTGAFLQENFWNSLNEYKCEDIYFKPPKKSCLLQFRQNDIQSTSYVFMSYSIARHGTVMIENHWLVL